MVSTIRTTVVEPWVLCGLLIEIRACNNLRQRDRKEKEHKKRCSGWSWRNPDSFAFAGNMRESRRVGGKIIASSEKGRRMQQKRLVTLSQSWIDLPASLREM